MSTLAERYNRRKDNSLVDTTTMASVKLGLLLGDAECHRRIDDLLESVGYVSVLNVGALDLKVWANHHDLNTEAEFLRHGLEPEYAVKPLFDEWKRQGVSVDCGKNSLFLYVPGYESVHDRPTVILPDVPSGLPWRALTTDRKAAIAGNISGFSQTTSAWGLKWRNDSRMGRNRCSFRSRMAWMSNAYARGLSIASECLTANGISMI